MGKDLKGKELGRGITQESTGLYSARFVDRFGKRRHYQARIALYDMQKVKAMRISIVLYYKPDCGQENW